MGKFFHSVGGFFSKLFGNAASWSQKASSALTLVAPLTNEIISLSAGEEEAGEVTRVVHEVQSDLAAAAMVISQAHGTDGANASGVLNSTLTAVSANLDILLSAGHIKNPTNKARIAGHVNTVLGEVKAILSVLPKPSTP